MLESLPMPPKDVEVAVTPTHVSSADGIFVQFDDYIKRFEDFQYTTVQKIQLKQLSYIPSKWKIRIELPSLFQLYSTLQLILFDRDRWFRFGTICFG